MVVAARPVIPNTTEFDVTCLSCGKVHEGGLSAAEAPATRGTLPRCGKDNGRLFVDPVLTEADRKFLEFMSEAPSF